MTTLTPGTFCLFTEAKNRHERGRYLKGTKGTDESFEGKLLFVSGHMLLLLAEEEASVVKTTWLMEEILTCPLESNQTPLGYIYLYKEMKLWSLLEYLSLKLYLEISLKKESVIGWWLRSKR